MRLRSTPPAPRLISLVSMIDVLLIMLVFFMVTSTYLNLDMIPMAEQGDETASPAAAAGNAVPLVIRLGADGQPHVRGQLLSLAQVAQLVRAGDVPAAVTILPSLRADTQSLVSLMDTLTLAGVENLRILRVDGP